MSEEIKILVKAEDIMNSNYSDNHDCAIIRALKREGYKANSAGGDYVKMGDYPEVIWDMTKQESRALVDRYDDKDNGKPVEDLLMTLTNPRLYSKGK
jgi:hypothetical protein